MSTTESVLVVLAVYLVISACFRLNPKVVMSTGLRLDRRAFIVSAILFLLIAAVTATKAGTHELTQRLTSYTFYLLVIGLFLALFQYIREGSDKDK